MDAVKITSRDNPLIKLTRELIRSAKSRREHSSFVIEGARLCGDAALSGIIIRNLLYTEDFAARQADTLSLISEKASELYEIMPHVAEKISETASSQGIFCVCEMPDGGPDISDFYTAGNAVLALENIQDPGNLGAIARTAEALGFAGIILSAGCCDIYNPKVLRASMGAFFRIPVYVPEDFAGCIKAAGLPVFACVPDGAAQDIRTADFSGGGVLLIGNEGAGLTAEAESAAGVRVTIPMRGRAESLSAAAAAAIAMWTAVEGN